MAADLTTYDAILKETYAPAIVEQLQSRTILLKRLKRSSKEIEGREFIIPTHGRRNEGVGARGSTSTSLPTAGQEGYDNAVLTPKYLWGQIALQETLLDTTDKGISSAFVKGMASEVKGMTTSIVVDTNRQLWNDGTGLLATLGVTSASVTIICTNTKYIRVNMYVDILVKSSGAVVATNRKVTTVTKNVSFIIDGDTVTTGATHGVYRAGNKSGASNYELVGIQQIVVATGAFEGLNPATAGQEYWAAQVRSGAVPGTPDPISEVRMQTVYDDVDQFSDAGEVSLIASNYGARRAYFNLLQSMRRFQNTRTLEGGFEALEFNGKPFVIDKDCPASTIYFLDESHIKLYQLTPPKWMDRDGTVLKWDGAMGYKGVYHWFVNMGCDARNTQGVLNDVIEA